MSLEINGQPKSAFYLLVDRCSASEVSGRAFFPLSNEYVPYSSVIRLLDTVDSFLDTLRLPQKAQDFRSFEKMENPEKGRSAILDSKEIHKPSNGEKATFLIKIKYRQNATFQGSIHWLEEDKTQCFRSDLEMLKLIDEAVATHDDEDCAHWQSER